MKIGAVILAAGSSSRMNGADKQLAILRGSAVVYRSAMAFCACADVVEIVIVTNKDNMKAVSGLFTNPVSIPIKVVEGGKNRFASAKNGFFALSGACDYIAVHDGARPLVKPCDIEKIAEAAREYGAAVLCVPAKDTVKLVADGIVIGSPERSTLFQAQTPQIFERGIYAEAVRSAEESGLSETVTDDSQAVEQTGIKVAAVVGSYSNIKLTTPVDFVIAEALLEAEERGAL